MHARPSSALASCGECSQSLNAALKLLRSRLKPQACTRMWLCGCASLPAIRGSTRSSHKLGFERVHPSYTSLLAWVDLWVGTSAGRVGPSALLHTLETLALAPCLRLNPLALLRPNLSLYASSFILSPYLPVCIVSTRISEGTGEVCLCSGHTNEMRVDLTVLSHHAV